MKRFIFALLCPLIALSQERHVISYGTALPVMENIGGYQFLVSDNQEGKKILVENLSQFLFEKPGTFSIYSQKDQQSLTHEEEHIHVPDSIYLIVDSIRMAYIPSTIKISEIIRANKPSDHILMSVDLQMDNYSSQPYKFHIKPIRSAGIGTEIIALPIEKEQILFPGINTIQYRLSGICHQPGYIQFDFEDHINFITPIGLPQPVVIE